MNDRTMALDPRSFLRTISAQDFLNFGLHEMAYVRPVSEEDGKTRYLVCTADGHGLITLDNKNAAMATILHNNMEPVTLH